MKRFALLMMAVMFVGTLTLFSCQNIKDGDIQVQDEVMTNIAKSAGWWVGYAVGKSADAELEAKVEYYWSKIRAGEFTIPMANEALELIETDTPAGAYFKFQLLELVSQFGVVVDQEIGKVVAMGNVQPKHLDAAEKGFENGFFVGEMEAMK